MKRKCISIVKNL